MNVIACLIYPFLWVQPSTVPPPLCGWALFSFTLFLNFAMCSDQASSQVSATDKFCCSIFENGEDDCCEGGYIWRWLRRDIAATLRTISVKLSCCSILCKCPDFILLIRTLSQSNGCISNIIGFDSQYLLDSSSKNVLKCMPWICKTCHPSTQRWTKAGFPD